MTRPVRAAAAKARLAARSAQAVSDDEGEVDAFSPSSRASSHSSPSPSPSPAPSSSPSPPSEPARGRKRKRLPATDTEIPDIEDCVPRPHGREYHATSAVAGAQAALLEWFDRVRDERAMPWRKAYDPSLSDEQKAQRAYEVWVSEVMLQQTQVATVIMYWRAWLARWPTIADLARAGVEDVNAAWRGLGYYRRARGLLAGAQAVMDKYGGRLPSDPETLEKHIPGVGRYTAGAICSIAYGVRTPIVDGNIHRVLTRLLGVHAPQTAPATVRFLWDAATELVSALPDEPGIAGDWNQALMELGATVCRPRPSCRDCPLAGVCAARTECVDHPDPLPQDGDACDLCHPLPAPLLVTAFPMKKVKKASREEQEIVVVTEWKGEEGRRWLFAKRPEKGLLAGLFEPPSVPATDADRLEQGKQHVLSLVGDTVTTRSHTASAAVPHIFSHINMTYHAQHMVLTSTTPPTIGKGLVWLDEAGVLSANVGTGVKKVWAAVYGGWGTFESGGSGGKRKRK